MLRGVNKQIIEISDTGSECFEKALFFVKVNSRESNEKLEAEAKRIVEYHFGFENNIAPHEGFLRYTENKTSKRRKHVLVGLVLGIALAVAAAVIVFGVI